MTSGIGTPRIKPVHEPAFRLKVSVGIVQRTAAGRSGSRSLEIESYRSLQCPSPISRPLQESQTHAAFSCGENAPRPDAILTRDWAKLPMAMKCPAIEPAQAARELVVRDRSPKKGESPPPRDFGPNLTASDFGGSLEWEVGHVVVRLILGKIPARGGPGSEGSQSTNAHGRLARHLHSRRMRTYRSYGSLPERPGAAFMGSRWWRVIRWGLGFFVALWGTLFCATQSTQAAGRFFIRVERQTSGVDAQGAAIVKGRLIVNGQDFGETVENPSYKLLPGTFEGAIRYVNQPDLVLGSGVRSTIGDLLVTIDRALGPAGRADILFRSGDLSSQATGSILLGPAVHGSAGDRILPPSHPLYKMRVALYGSATPTTYPDRPATITIAEGRPLTPPSAPTGLRVGIR
jgi:hypothetical protein